MKLYYFNCYLLISVLFLFTSCNLFDYSSYEVPDLDEDEINLNTKNSKKISKIDISNTDTFCFALIADSHIEYDKLEKVIRHINHDKSISFVIHLGDMTDGGIQKEYCWANNRMSGLKIPYIVIIGNHDYLCNGDKIYNKMFGKSSFSFVFHDTKFVCFDNIVWENNNTYPNFNWLNTNLSDYNQYKQVFVFSHIPPFADQFDEYCRNTFTNIITSNNVSCTFHGHVHSYSFNQYYENSNCWCFTADYIKSRVYYKVYVSESTFNIASVEF